MHAGQSELAGRTAQFIFAQFGDRWVFLQKAGGDFAHLTARGTHQMHRHAAPGIQSQGAAHAERLVIWVSQHRQQGQRSIGRRIPHKSLLYLTCQYTGNFGSISIAQALIPPFKFFALRKPALASSSRARAERVPPLQNTTISSALSSLRRRAPVARADQRSAIQTGDLRFVGLAHIEQTDGFAAPHAVGQLRHIDIPAAADCALFVVMSGTPQSLVVDRTR
jgi:hypothetical protein